MKTEIIDIDEVSEEKSFSVCRDVILRGGLVAFPTETVYGLGADALNEEAAAKIYSAKGRPSDNPLIVHIGKREQVTKLVTKIPSVAEKLMDAFWPGPLTIIFEKSEIVPKTTTGGLNTIAIRMPSYPYTNRLLSYLGIPIAAPSANLSGRPSTTRATHVIEDLNGRVDLILEGEDSEIGLESTIIDVTGDIPVLLRPGAITISMLEKVIGKVSVDPAITKEAILSHDAADFHPKAPGMKYRHYAPKAPLTVYYGEEKAVLLKLLSLEDDRIGILTTKEHAPLFKKGVVRSLGSHDDFQETAHRLFDALRSFDEESVTAIYSEDFSGPELGEAIMNRLLKASGGMYKEVKGENI